MGTLTNCCQKQTSATIKNIRINPKSHRENQKLVPFSASQVNNLTLRSKIPEIQAESRKTRGPQDYQHLKYLGKGAFGCVVLAQEKATGKKYAMKIIQKSKIQQFNLLQCDLIRNISHQEFLVGIKETFQNETKIYIVMQYLPMGDLYFFLSKMDSPFPQSALPNIAAELVVGVQLLHSQGIVYRQLKPENILVTEEGHIKLTDYGLSKVLVEQKNLISTFVGTLEYMPPEAYSGTFGQKADIWALGIILHELLFKQNLFEIEDSRIVDMGSGDGFPIEKSTIVSKINSKIGCMSIQFRNLLLRLLEIDPEARISLEEIKNHEFFKDIDWQKVRRRENDPPLKEIKNKKDIIRFRDVTAEKYLRKAVNKKSSNENYQFQLFEFRNSQ